MNKLQMLIMYYCCTMIAFPSLEAMFVQGARLGGRAYQRSGATIRRIPAQAAAYQRLGQSRSVSTVQQLKNSFKPLTKQAQVVSLPFGAALFESGAHERAYDLQSDAPGIRLQQKLYFRRTENEPLEPTKNKANAAYSLTASIIGLVVGAAETNKLNDPVVKKSIIDQWRAEHETITNGSVISQKKVMELMDLVDEEYHIDKNHARSILLGFLYAKSNPNNNHDAIHYYSSLNQFFPVFEDNKTITSYVIPTESATRGNNTILNRLATMAQSFKNYIYTPEEYNEIHATIKNLNPQERITAALEDQFEEIVSTIIAKSTNPDYPARVIQGYYGYQGQAKRPNCVETAMQDLCNIILFNKNSQLFDLSLLPATIKPHADFNAFYEQYSNARRIRSHERGQAFMDLVSDIPGISYVTGNYELKADSGCDNLLGLFNHFFGINARDLPQLGTLLSDERRTITFRLQRKTSSYDGRSIQHVSMVIKNHADGSQLIADFCFQSGHGWLEVAPREGLQSDLLLNPAALLHRYNISPQARALLHIQTHISILKGLGRAMPASFYYIFNVDWDRDKEQVIKHVLTYSLHNPDKSPNTEAIDYAYSLFEKMVPEARINVFYDILKSGVLKINKKFENAYTMLKPISSDQKSDIIELIMEYDSNNQNAINYAINLYGELSNKKQVELLNTILLSELWLSNEQLKKDVIQCVMKNIKDTLANAFNNVSLRRNFIDLVKNLYDNMPNNTSKVKFINETMSLVAVNDELYEKMAQQFTRRNKINYATE